MRMAVLGSGSAGNASVLDAPGARLLVDAGLSARQLSQRLEKLGLDPHSLDGILLSHEHSDHTRGLEVFLRKHRIPVYATALTREALQDRCGAHVEWRLFQRGCDFEVAGMTVSSFAVPHDAVDPVGFVCRSRSGARIGIATDLGHVTSLVRESLRGVNGLFVEANYDQYLLESDTKRPWSIKQRISSRHGHLSNAQTAALVEELMEDGLRSVVLGHLSRDCNTPEVAVCALREGKARRLPIRVSSQGEPTPWVSLEVPGAAALCAVQEQQELLF